MDLPFPVSFATFLLIFSVPFVVLYPCIFIDDIYLALFVITNPLYLFLFKVLVIFDQQTLATLKVASNYCGKVGNALLCGRLTQYASYTFLRQLG